MASRLGSVQEDDDDFAPTPGKVRASMNQAWSHLKKPASSVGAGGGGGGGGRGGAGAGRGSTAFGSEAGATPTQLHRSASFAGSGYGGEGTGGGGGSNWDGYEGQAGASPPYFVPAASKP
jgi:hypothetical protein